MLSFIQVLDFHTASFSATKGGLPKGQVFCKYVFMSWKRYLTSNIFWGNTYIYCIYFSCTFSLLQKSHVPLNNHEIGVVIYNFGPGKMGRLGSWKVQLPIIIIHSKHFLQNQLHPSIFPCVYLKIALQWCHTGCEGVSNHQHHHCLLNRLFKRRSKKTSKLCVTGLCETGEFLAKMANNVENISIWWHHHGNIVNH